MASQLNASQVLILQTLAKHRTGTMTRAQIEEKSGATLSAGNLGPVYKETLDAGNGEYAESLYGLGMVRPEQSEDEGVVWTITAKGRKAALGVKAKSRGTTVKVDADALDTVVKKFRTTRTYGMELYTEDDLKEIRSQLPKEFSSVEIDDLRLQICNRRKQGAFTDTDAKNRKFAQAILRHIGPAGTLLKGLLTAEQVKKLEKIVKG